MVSIETVVLGKTWRQVSILAVYALVVAVCTLTAQQTQPQPEAPQQSGHGEPGPHRRLQRPGYRCPPADPSGDHQFLRIESQLGQLPADQAQFYRGILANRSNDLKKSIQLLEPLVDQVAASGNTGQEKLLRKALAEDYSALRRLGKAAKAYQTLETRLQAI